MIRDLCFNEVRLGGKVTSDVMYSHERYGKKFYKFFVTVKRLNGVDDTLRVIIPEIMLNNEIIKGKAILVFGEYRSYNASNGEVMLSIYANNIILYDLPSGENINSVVLTGFVCKKSPIMKTKQGKKFMRVLLAVNYPNKVTSYVPCVVWMPAFKKSKQFNVGDKMTFWGFANSRMYSKTYEDGRVEQKVTYECSVNNYSFATI